MYVIAQMRFRTQALYLLCSGSFIKIIIWSAVEYGVAIICANIPALAPLVRAVLRRFYNLDKVTSVRKSVVRRMSRLPDKTQDRSPWIQEPSPTAWIPVRANRDNSTCTTVSLYRDDEVYGNEYVRGGYKQSLPAAHVSTMNAYHERVNDLEAGRVEPAGQTTPTLPKAWVQ